MIEIRIHGRGGQGVKKASQILGRAGYLAGFQTQDFAMYGAERSGAPVTSFVRLDKKKISTRGYIFEPDYILVIDDTLNSKETLLGKKSATKIVTNSIQAGKSKNVYNIDATHIAIEETGTNKGANIAILGEFIKLFKLINLKHLKKAIEVELGKHPEALKNNISIAERAYNRIDKS